MTTSLPLISPAGLVTLRPPTSRNPYYRMEWKDAFGRRRQTHVGKDEQAAQRRAESHELLLLGDREAAPSALPTTVLFDRYLDPQRNKFPKDRRANRRRSWSSGYTKRAERAFGPSVRARLGSVRLSELNKSHVIDQLNELGSDAEARRFLAFLRYAISYGITAGLLRADQRSIADIEVLSHTFSERVRDEDRVEIWQGESDSLVPAYRIPTHAQVAQLGDAPVPYEHWKGLVEVLAFCGPRIHEALDLRAADVHERPAAGGARTEHLGAAQVPGGLRLHVVRQAIEEAGGHGSGPTKNGKARRVSVPDVTPTGFELAAWLRARRLEALEEQGQGRNDLALLFPSLRGTRWWVRNLRARVFDVAATQAGWPTETLKNTRRTMVRNRAVISVTERRMWIQPIHALRHRFATTALQEWGWSGVELCQQGGWESPEFVYRRYVGVTDDLADSAAEKQRRAIRAADGGRS